jgi:hypothetical protein
LEPCEERSLVVTDREGRKLAALPLPDGSFDYVFKHSFHLTAVRERYRVEPDGAGGARLRLYELRYSSAGAGMPEDAELGFKLVNGVFVLAMDRSFSSIPLMVSPLPGHGVEIGGRLWPFAAWAEPGKALALRGEARKTLRFRR